MATCTQSIVAAIASGIGSVPELFPNTLTPISFTQVTNQLLRINIPTFQTVNFSVVLSAVGSLTAVNVSFSVYRMDTPTTFTDMGGVILSELNSSFTKDFTIGNYVICIRTNNLTGYTGTVLGAFTGYPTTAQFAPVANDGASVVFQFDNIRPPRPCDEAMFFEILEGALPPGIAMDPLGKVRGILPNLDCIDPEDQFSPSQNWLFEQDGTVYPWGRQWRFKVRVSLQDYPESFSDDWFCIRIHNNWDFDRDNFLAQVPFDSFREIEIIEPPKKLPETLCIEKCKEEPPVFVPQPIQEICAPCVNPDIVTDVALIPIPETLSKLPPNQFMIWYDQNMNKDLSGECPEVQVFMENLKNSPLFKKLLAQNGLGGERKSSEKTALELLIASQFQNFLQITASTMIEGRNPEDLDFQMQMWRNQENQRLPITANGLTGESLSVNL